MKCQILFPGENKKNIVSLSSAGSAQRVVKVKNRYIRMLCRTNVFVLHRLAV